ncbi:MAG: protocatechuate 3,4-dioxygenase subunit alpha [Anaerolineales bacterium]
MADQSPSQTVGPFFSLGLIRGCENMLVNSKTAGQPIMIRGFVYDGKGVGVPDAAIEIWQADGQGIFNHPDDPRHTKGDPNFFGFGRAPTDDEGEYWFKTIKPGAMPPARSETYAPYINVRVFMRGLLIQAHTRLYFSDETEANATDPVLSSIEAARRNSLLAVLQSGKDVPTYRFDIRMQGENETVFFNP